MTKLFIEQGGMEFTVEVLDYHPTIPAYVTGPPEDCYPAEDGWVAYHISEVIIPEGNIVMLNEIDDDAFDELVLKAYEESLDD